MSDLENGISPAMAAILARTQAGNELKPGPKFNFHIPTLNGEASEHHIKAPNVCYGPRHFSGTMTLNNPEEWRAWAKRLSARK